MLRYSEREFAELLCSLRTTESDLLCPEGTALLRTFAEARPADFSFLQPEDMVDLQNCAFQGIPEWDTFADHASECSSCKEREESP